MNAPLAPGTVIAAKYRVDGVIGSGGMGVVVAATHLHLGQRVALKFLLPEVARNPAIVERFAREARAAARIQSEHVARVLDTGTLDDGTPYMVMEHLQGRDLDELLRTQGRLSGQDAIEYVLQACEAVAEAHVAGIVHRDLKPANLFLMSRADGSPCIKVLDFGISKSFVADPGAPGQSPLTQTSSVLGSPKYMSPEQLNSARTVDARTDIWALGVTLHELLTGESAFRADTVPQLYVAILSGMPEPLRLKRPDAPPGVEAIITRCLEKDPSRRYGTVGELASALAPFAPPRARTSLERIGGIFAKTGGAVDPATSHPGNRSPQLGSGIPPTAPGLAPPAPPVGSAGPAPPPFHGYHAPGPPPAGFPPAPFGGYAPPQPPHAYGPQPYGVGGYGPAPQLAPPPRERSNMALIVFLVLLGVLVFGFGGCVVCSACVGLAGST